MWSSTKLKQAQSNRSSIRRLFGGNNSILTYIIVLDVFSHKGGVC